MNSFVFSFVNKFRIANEVFHEVFCFNYILGVFVILKQNLMRMYLLCLTTCIVLPDVFINSKVDAVTDFILLINFFT